MAEARKKKCYDFKFKNCGLYLRAACINYFSSYLRLVFKQAISGLFKNFNLSFLSISRSAAEYFETEMPGLALLTSSSKLISLDDVCVLKNIYLSKIKNYFLKLPYQIQQGVNRLTTNVAFLCFDYLRNIYLICYRDAQSFHESSQELVGLFLLCIPNLK